MGSTTRTGDGPARCGSRSRSRPLRRSTSPAQERQRSLDLFATGSVSDWRNRLIWGDKKYVLPALADEFANAVDLIYIDPPFAIHSAVDDHSRLAYSEMLS